MATSICHAAAQPVYLTSASAKPMLFQPALYTIQPARANMTAYTPGPAQSMNTVIAFMPL